MKLSSLINSRRLNEDQIAAAEELIDRGFNTVVDVAIGVGEVGLSMISGAVAEPASGLYGLGSLVFQDLDSATGDIESIQNRMTYEPRTEAGKKGIGYLGSTIGKIGEAVDNFSGYLGDKVLDATDSPELAAAAATLPTAAFEILPTGKAPTKVSAKQSAIDPDLWKKLEDSGRKIVTHEGGEIKGILDDPNFGGLFGKYGDRSSSGLGSDSKQTTFSIDQGRIAREGDVDFDFDKSMEFIKDSFDDVDEGLFDDLYEVIANDDGNIVLNNPEISEVLSRYGEVPEYEAQRLRGILAKRQGFDAVEMKDETGISVLIPHNYSPDYEVVYRDYDLSE